LAWHDPLHVEWKTMGQDELINGLVCLHADAERSGDQLTLVLICGPVELTVSRY
jgi:hypothetical protein